MKKIIAIVYYDFKQNGERNLWGMYRSEKEDFYCVFEKFKKDWVKYNLKKVPDVNFVDIKFINYEDLRKI